LNGVPVGGVREGDGGCGFGGASRSESVLTGRWVWWVRGGGGEVGPGGPSMGRGGWGRGAGEVRA